MNLSFKISYQAVVTAIIGCVLGLFLISGLPWNYILGFLVVTGFVILFFVNPLFCLGALLFVRTGIDYFLVQIRFGVGGANLGLGGGLSLLLISLVLIAFLIQKDEISAIKISHPLVKLYAIYCCFSVLNTTYSDDKVEAFKIILRIFTVFALLVWSITKVRNEEDGYFLLKAIAWSFLPSLIMGFVSGNYTINESRGVRFSASLSHPNILANYILILMACFATKLHFRDMTARVRILTLLGVGVLIGMLVFTKTRSGLISAMALFLLYGWFNNRRLILPVLAVCGCLMMFPFVNSGLVGIYEVKGGKVELNETDNFTWRIEKSKILFREVVKKPILGHGFGASKTFNTSDKALGAHNDYAQFLVDSGIVGFCLYFGSFVYLLMKALRTRRTVDKSSLLYKISIFFVIVTPAFLLMSLTDNLNNYIIIQWYYWVIAGIFISLSWNLKRAPMKNLIREDRASK